MISKIAKSLNPRRFICRFKRHPCWFKFSGIVTVIVVLLWYRKYAAFKVSKTMTKMKCRAEALESHSTIMGNPHPSTDNWIVVTTIYAPSPQLEALSHLKNWQLLIIEDEKTPVAHWKSHKILQGSIYLDLGSQKQLPYCIVPMIPINSYTRKNIGYLYAIKHGAKYIYDTDDDNMPEPQDNNAMYSLSTHSGFLVKPAGTLSIVNPYPYFGKDNIWPRGFPLELISGQQTKKDLLKHFKLEEYKFDDSVVIHHGLVNADPDVDAIYRLTKPDHKNVDLQQNLPIVLDNTIYGLFNSQNTVFERSSFWALILPVGVTMRVTDIWRSYWSQTLMKLTDQKLAILFTSVNQTRNKHSYLDDFIQENDLYVKSGKLLEYLSTWKCHGTEFTDCVIELSHDLVKSHFWTYKDAYLVEAWISDLKSIGYVFPVIDGLV
ncbi:unnamed protein product [Owenia fusiformis]|uniref:Uncharacterized protein n=1 Tax=Owenia fusiformis TaxID=6347 RepID=A0A8J1UVS0_OWEFU|nr:unnamed protein product [Owenia fusiformis]